MTIYDTIGTGYNGTRHADGRILTPLLALLGCAPGAIVADIGAGTGNYSFELARRGYRVHALEPSQEMQRQRKEHANLQWFEGFAENIPFACDYFDGVICTMATHHFISLEEAYREMHRILKNKGVLVVFTQDPRRGETECWIRNYFGVHHSLACEKLPRQEEVIAIAASVFHTTATVTPFILPGDCADGFFYSAWRDPERYLDRDFRKGISCFALANITATAEAVRRLKEDLRSGAWDTRYGFYRKRDGYDGGYYFLSIKK